MSPSIQSVNSLETESSRLFFLKTDGSHINDFETDGILRFSKAGADKYVWKTLLKDDLVIIFLIKSPLKGYCVKIISKTIIFDNDHASAMTHPFWIFVKIIGFFDLKSITNEIFFTRDALSSPARNTFVRYWEKASSFGMKIDYQNKQDTIFEKYNIKISLAQSAEDYNYISKIATQHPFGLREAFISLIATQNGKYMGALLADYSYHTNKNHGAQWRLFGDYSNWIKDRAITILRIYSERKMWKTQSALISCLLNIAPSIVDRQLSVIEAVSYEYHPLSRPFGFNVVLPRTCDGAFYYWKPYSLPATTWLPAETLKTDILAVKDIIKGRKKSKFWIVAVNTKFMDVAIRGNAWALRHTSWNARHWNSIENGNYVFFKNENDTIVAYAQASNKEKRYVKNLERFPLWIDFNTGIRTGFKYNLDQHTLEKWYLDNVKGGLSRLPNEFGAQVKLFADYKLMEGKMWVEPNPYLLRGTSFTVNQQQAFVVLSWTLKDSVLPILKEILEKEGYRAVFAGDRDGQVIFEDIWLMLNESKFVIVDFTNKRPNVYLEYGMALVLGKPIIAITQNPDDIPSDTPNLKYLVYKDSIGDKALHNLPKAIRHTLEDFDRVKTGAE